MPRTKKEEKIEENAVVEDKVEDKKEIAAIEEKVVSEIKEKKEDTILTSLDNYIKTASYLGTKVITPSMKKYVYRRRLDGLAILNTNIVDKKLKEAIDFIVQYKPNEWTLICKRESGWRAAKMFSELTGVRLFTKKYPAGIVTNTELPNFFETKMMMICDPWLDKNALNDARKSRVPVVAVCDTNNHTANVDVVIIANNKSNKSLGLIFWLLAKEYMKAHGIKAELPSLEDFAGEKLILEEPKKRIKKLKEGKSEEQKIEERMREIGKADEGV
jgi:small subunit ribosomal protein S2